MTYAEFFSEIKTAFMGTDVSDIKEHLAYQFNIEDEEAVEEFIRCKIKKLMYRKLM